MISHFYQDFFKYVRRKTAFCSIHFYHCLWWIFLAPSCQVFIQCHAHLVNSVFCFRVILGIEGKIEVKLMVCSWGFKVETQGEKMLPEGHTQQTQFFTAKWDVIRWFKTTLFHAQIRWESWWKYLKFKIQ